MRLDGVAPGMYCLSVNCPREEKSAHLLVARLKNGGLHRGS